MIIRKAGHHDFNTRTWRRAAASILLLTLQLSFCLFAIQSAQAQTFTALYTFRGKGDGEYPAGGVLRDRAGHLYGVTYAGGSFNYGTVFEIDPGGKDTVLHSFWSGDGAQPEASLVRDSQGNLYGTTYNGGALEGGKCIHGCGTVFKLDSAGKLTVLYAFSGGSDGGNPTAGLLLGPNGDLYGTTTAGGNLSCHDGTYVGCGVVFKLDANGKQTVLHTFARTDGEDPSGGLIRDKAGNLYGVTAYGGSAVWGTVFKLDPTGKETVLYSFTGKTDGGLPEGTLVQDAAGNLYGVAAVDGDPHCRCGLVFKVDQTGKETVLYTFLGGTDGSEPFEGVIRDSAGNLYGTTSFGGSSGCDGLSCGTVFKLDTSGNETVLYTFTGGSDGAVPSAGLLMDKSGNLYGAAGYGGDLSCGWNPYGGCGVVFKLTP